MVEDLGETDRFYKEVPAGPAIREFRPNRRRQLVVAAIVVAALIVCGGVVLALTQLGDRGRELTLPQTLDGVPAREPAKESFSLEGYRKSRGISRVYSADESRVLVAGAIREGSGPIDTALPLRSEVGDGFCATLPSGHGGVMTMCTSHGADQTTVITEYPGESVDREELQRSARDLREEVFAD